MVGLLSANASGVGVFPLSPLTSLRTEKGLGSVGLVQGNATVIEDWLGMLAKSVLGAEFKHLPLFST
jgi:hypothetical protein